MTREIKGDTQAIREDTTAIKEDTAQILAEIAKLQARLPRDDQPQRTGNFTLLRYLDNMTTYAETVGDVSDNESDSAIDVESHEENLKPDYLVQSMASSSISVPSLPNFERGSSGRLIISRSERLRPPIESSEGGKTSELSIPTHTEEILLTR